MRFLQWEISQQTGTCSVRFANPKIDTLIHNI